MGSADRGDCGCGHCGAGVDALAAGAGCGAAVSFRGRQDIQPGDWLSLTARLDAPPALGGPGASDLACSTATTSRAPWVPAMARDGVGCVVKDNKALIAVSLRPEALAEDCDRAQVLVSAAQAFGRKGPAEMIDQKKAAEGEGWQITLSPTPTTECVREYRGERPWVVSNEN